jgi:UDP-N-acetyl-D-mannosaminuronic acid dehydrogenase
MEYDICIVGGAGHVGLPLAIVFANHGRKTLIYDLNTEVMDLVKSGVVPFTEEGGEAALKSALASGNLHFSNDASLTGAADTLIITIGTPVDEFLNPVYKAMSQCMDAFIPFISDEQLIILRSTVPPGVTNWLHRYLGAKGFSPRLAFCPERVVQGKAITEIQSLPQIVSGATEEAADAAADVFSALGAEIVRMQPMEAEFAKLFCNAYRYINFAITNQFYMMVESAGLDYDRILSGMKQDYDRMAGLPSAGLAAGPCLFKDTLQLCSFYENQFSLGFDAVMVNEGLPLFIVRNMEKEHNLLEMTVGLLGMAFKPNSDDTRSSLSYKLKKILHPRAKHVIYTDPHVTTDDSLLSLEDTIAQSDILILCVPHAAYKGLDLKGKPCVDIWNFLPRESAPAPCPSE